MSDAAVLEQGSPSDGPARPVTPATVSAPTPWRDRLAVAVAVFTPLLAYLGNLGYAPLAAIAGGFCIFMLRRPRVPSRGMWLLMVLVTWALVSEAWSPAAPRTLDLHSYQHVEALTGLKLVLQLPLYAALALMMQGVSEEGGRRASSVLVIGLAILAVVLIIEALDGSRVYMAIHASVGHAMRPDLAVRNVARACYTLALLFWPAFLAARGDRRLRPLVVVTAVGFLGGAAALHVDAPLAAAVVSTGVFLLVRSTGRTGLWACLGVTMLYFVAAPLVIDVIGRLGFSHATPGHFGKLSWAARLQIWSFTERMLLLHPITGWGLDASRVWPDHIPLHPHDAALQLWLELGPLGAALGALFFAWVFSRIAVLERTDRLMAAAAAASASAYLVIGALSFGVWQEWWLGLGAVTMGVCGWVAAARREEHGFVRTGALTPLH